MKQKQLLVCVLNDNMERNGSQRLQFLNMTAASTAQLQDSGVWGMLESILGNAGHLLFFPFFFVNTTLDHKVTP